MANQQDYRIPGPPFSLQFSAVDQVTPPIYSRRVLIFSRANEDREDAALALKRGLERTVHEMPFLAGQMGLGAQGWTVKDGGHARLRVQNIDLNFEDLKKSGFDERMLVADDISSVPGIADPQEEWHVCRVQANFIRGGLLLVLSINHTITDGYGITKVTEALARNSRQSSLDLVRETVSLDRSALSRSNAVPDVTKLDAYSIVTGQTNLGAAAPEVVTTTFRLPVAALKALKIAASPDQGWITTHDAVNALCWLTHARSRHAAGLLAADEAARFAFPVDFRSLLDPPLSQEYYGNAVLMTKVELPVATLLGAHGLAAAAVAIREGVKRVNTAYVQNFIAVAASLENPRQLKINLKLSEPHTGLGSTSYKSFAHSTMNWDASLGTFERFRLSWGVTGEGMSIILPVLHDGSWEVTVTLLKEVADAFCGDDTWATYCKGSR